MLLPPGAGGTSLAGSGRRPDEGRWISEGAWRAVFWEGEAPAEPHAWRRLGGSLALPARPRAHP